MWAITVSIDVVQALFGLLQVSRHSLYACYAGAMWAVIASTRPVTSSMWDVTSYVWAVTASMWAVTGDM